MKELMRLLMLNKYQKEMQFNQFDSIKDNHTISRSANSPVKNQDYKSLPSRSVKESAAIKENSESKEMSITKQAKAFTPEKRSVDAEEESKEKPMNISKDDKEKMKTKNPRENRNKIPKHPTQTSNKRKSTSKIPGVKPNSVSRSNNISRKEEPKKHKGKTPSFGNSNSPLFLDNEQVEEERNAIPEPTAQSIKTEEAKLDRKRLTPKSTTPDITEKFKAPVLSNREMRKSGSKKPLRPLHRNRNPSRPSPHNKKSPHATPKNTKTDSQTPKEHSLRSNPQKPYRAPPPNVGRRQQSVGMKAVPRTPTGKQKNKTTRIDDKRIVK